MREEGKRVAQAQRDAFTAFRDWFASGYPISEKYADAVHQLDTLWRGNPSVFGERAPHVLADGKFPSRWRAFSSLRQRRCIVTGHRGETGTR
jgi:hypothetical protein